MVFVRTAKQFRCTETHYSAETRGKYVLTLQLDVRIAYYYYHYQTPHKTNSRARKQAKSVSSQSSSHLAVPLCQRRIAKRIVPLHQTLDTIKRKVIDTAVCIHVYGHSTESVYISFLSRNILRLEVNVGTALRQSSVVTLETGEQLRDACDQGKRAVSSCFLV